MMDGVYMNLPKKFKDRMESLLGEEYKDFLQSYRKPYYGGMRVNTLKLSPEEFEHLSPFSVRKIPWVNNGYYYDTKEQPARHPYYHAGLYYIQEPSAMTPASLLPVEPGDMVLDLCAAPGGKSTDLGAKLKGEGMLVSNDISNSRAKALLKNIELFGITNALVLSEAPNKLSEYFNNAFDKILVDAPCSGEGMFRKSPAVIKNWEQYGVEYYNKLQKEIIIFAAKMLKPGGMMLYSTCTFSPEENEGTIAYLLKECPDIHLINALPSKEEQHKLGISFDSFDRGKPEWVGGPDELRHCVRLWPHKIEGEGHFIALLQKDLRSYTDKSIDGVECNTTENKSLEHKSFEHKNEGYNSLKFKSREYNGLDNNSSGYKSFKDKDRIVYPNKNKNIISDEAVEFLSDIIPFKDIDSLISQDRILIQNERVYMVPECYKDMKGLRTLRQGLLLGEMKKKVPAVSGSGDGFKTF